MDRFDVARDNFKSQHMYIKKKVQVYKSTSLQVYKSTSLQVYKSTSLQVYKSTSLQLLIVVIQKFINFTTLEVSKFNILMRWMELLEYLHKRYSCDKNPD